LLSVAGSNGGSGGLLPGKLRGAGRDPPSLLIGVFGDDVPIFLTRSRGTVTTATADTVFPVASRA
jgi:hypothetical protein